MIKLTLLHPKQAIPVKSWTFDRESVIRIGRSNNNHVVLYSAVVSRYHLELRQKDDSWTIINLGVNGTYLNDKPITQILAVDGIEIRLARSGPQIRVDFDANAHEILPEEELPPEDTDESIDEIADDTSLLGTTLLTGEYEDEDGFSGEVE
ncbi:MAG: FHA domain-containing protein [Cyanobacteriota bacterium]|nr:FHA domain-containing protein [Cyanobacteriota bacterium]